MTTDGMKDGDAIGALSCVLPMETVAERAYQ